MRFAYSFLSDSVGFCGKVCDNPARGFVGDYLMKQMGRNETDEKNEKERLIVRRMESARRDKIFEWI